MMGVYIEGFQLPEKSDMYYVKVECEAGKNPVATIWRKDLMGDWSFGAFEAIPVPPHGRLIDADALYKDLLEDVGYGEAERFNDYWLGEQPTIVPAEEATDGV